MRDNARVRTPLGYRTLMMRMVDATKAFMGYLPVHVSESTFTHGANIDGKLHTVVLVADIPCPQCDKHTHIYGFQEAGAASIPGFCSGDTDTCCHCAARQGMTE